MFEVTGKSGFEFVTFQIQKIYTPFLGTVNVFTTVEVDYQKLVKVLLERVRMCDKIGCPIEQNSIKKATVLHSIKFAFAANERII